MSAVKHLWLNLYIFVYTVKLDATMITWNLLQVK